LTDKRFNTLEEAENFVAGLEEPSGKYYGVVVGSTAGVYTDWDEVSELLKGSKGPKYKGFKTEAEAQDFVRANILSLKAGATKTTDVKVDAKAKVEAQRKVEAKATGEATGKRPPQKQTAASRTSPTIVYSDGSCLNNGKPNARAGVGVYFGAGDPRFVPSLLLPFHLHTWNRLLTFVCPPIPATSQNASKASPKPTSAPSSLPFFAPFRPYPRPSPFSSGPTANTQ